MQNSHCTRNSGHGFAAREIKKKKFSKTFILLRLQVYISPYFEIKAVHLNEANTSY